MYYQFVDEDGTEHGSFQTFLKAGETAEETGWYWWPCFPGCLPDTDDEPFGPFDTEQEAIDNANGRI